jgi:hypothetical protein
MFWKVKEKKSEGKARKEFQAQYVWLPKAIRKIICDTNS